MNLSLNRKLDKLDEKSEKALRQKVYDIYMKYGNNGDQVDAQASDYEKQVLMRYYYPKALERFRRYLPVFLPLVMKALFEWELFPILYKVQLSEATRKDDDTFTLEYYLDRLYDKTVNPELNHEFWSEALESIERGDERAPITDVVKRWREANKERDEIKEESYLKAVGKLKEEAEYEAETMRLERIERAKESQLS
jgi:hypothetical protein